MHQEAWFGPHTNKQTVTFSSFGRFFKEIIYFQKYIAEL